MTNNELISAVKERNNVACIGLFGVGLDTYWGRLTDYSIT